MGLNTLFDPYGANNQNNHLNPNQTGSTNPAVLVDKMIGTAYDVVKHVCLYMQQIRHLSANMAAIFRVSSNLEQLATTRVRFNVVAPSIAGTTSVTLNTANGVPDVTKIVGIHARLMTATGVIVLANSEYFTVGLNGAVMSVRVLTGAPANFAGAGVVVFIEIENE